MHQVLLVGSDHLALRILEQLRRDGCSVTLIALDEDWLSTVHIPQGVTVARGHAQEPLTLKAAGVERTETLFAITDKDEVNLGVALAALELNPALRIVMRQFNLRLGRLVARDLPQCEVLSLSALAAPTFALAAVTPGVVFAHEMREHTLVLRDVAAGSIPEEARDRRVVAVSRDGPVEWFPPSTDSLPPEARVLIATDEHALPPYQGRVVPRLRPKRQIPWSSNRLLMGTVAYLLTVISLASLYFQVALGMTPVDALYFVITVITSVGFGDFSLKDTDTLSKFVGMGVMVSGIMTTAVLFALVTNRLMARQQAFDQGRIKLTLKGHVVVCGLGVIGFRVAQALRRFGQRVVVIELDENGRFVAQARVDGIPVVIGDALLEKNLTYANAGSASAFVVCTSDDHLNLEIALHARSLIHGLPIVLRMFDEDLSRRVSTYFRLDTTFSSALLSAFRFAAQATDPSRLASLRFHGHEFEIHQYTVASEQSLAEALAGRDGRLIAVADARGALRFSPSPSYQLARGETLILALVGRPSHPSGTEIDLGHVDASP